MVAPRFMVIDTAGASWDDKVTAGCGMLVELLSALWSSTAVPVLAGTDRFIGFGLFGLADEVQPENQEPTVCLPVGDEGGLKFFDV